MWTTPRLTAKGKNALSYAYVPLRNYSLVVPLNLPHGIRSDGQIEIPPPAVEGFDRMQYKTVLGVTLSHNFSMTKLSWQAVYVLCTVSEHYTSSWYALGLSAVSLSDSRARQITLCRPCLGGFANAGERNRLEAFYRAMHVVIARYCYRKSSVRPSVCLSVRL